jgi:hypothetical protein
MAIGMIIRDEPGQTDVRLRPLWLALLVSGGLGLSLFFACATPFAAIATLAALWLPRRDALIAVGLVWLANQAVGYGLLGYPWTLDSLAWGAAIGVSSYLGLFAAIALSADRPVSLATSLPFVAAFVVYELGLYVTGVAMGAETGAFSFAVIRQVLLVNLAGLFGLLAASRLLVLASGAFRSAAPRGMVASPR